MVARPLLRWIIALIAARAPGHRLQVTYADGSSTRLYDDDGPPEARIRFRTARAERHALLYFYQGLFEGYIEGEVELEGERPIATLAAMGHAALGEVAPRGWAGRLLTRNPLVRVRQLAQELRQSNRDRRRARDNAIFHYGHDPRFFEYLLGETVGYSEGYWPPGTTTLDDAKLNLYDYVARKLRLEPGMRVVEVGSGWGYMPMLLADRWGCEVTVYNPVPRQNDYMRARLARRGLGERIRIVEGDHRDIAREGARFDRYLSIGVFEHVGLTGYAEWVGSIAAALRPGGIGVLSTTTKMLREMTEYLTLKYIFPGGHLPSLPLTLEMMGRFGLTVLDCENLWPHYRRTVACWLANLERHWAAIHRLDPERFDERFRRIWTMYLAGTVETFDAGLDLFHITFIKGRDPEGYPMTRDALPAATAAPARDFYR